MLAVKDLFVSYGAISALAGVSFTIEAGRIVTLIGANGAGKTTTLRALSGLLRPKSGSVVFQGEDITQLPAHRIVARGLGHVPEGRMVFANLTVDENLAMGAYLLKDKARITRNRDYVFGIFPRLQERLAQDAGTLSGGEQQMVAIGRALMARPRLLCMDEPSMGLSPVLVEQVFDIIQTINRQGTTIFMVEQNANMALQIAHRAYVLQTGQVVLSGAAEELRQNPMIREAYLGEMKVE